MAEFKYSKTDPNYTGKMRKISTSVKGNLPKGITSNPPHQCNCKGGCKDGGKCCGKHHQH